MEDPDELTVLAILRDREAARQRKDWSTAVSLRRAARVRAGAAGVRVPPGRTFERSNRHAPLARLTLTRPAPRARTASGTSSRVRRKEADQER